MNLIPHAELHNADEKKHQKLADALDSIHQVFHQAQQHLQELRTYANIIGQEQVAFYIEKGWRYFLESSKQFSHAQARLSEEKGIFTFSPEMDLKAIMDGDPGPDSAAKLRKQFKHLTLLAQCKDQVDVHLRTQIDEVLKDADGFTYVPPSKKGYRV